MEFGASSRIDSGANIIGVSWTAASPTSEANLLVTTTESRVAVYSAEDRNLLSSWITRPGSYNKFSVAAVQNRLLKKFLCIQNGNRLFSWHESEPSLETAAKRKLPADVYALRTSKRLRLNCIVYTDGAVSFIDDSLADVATAAGQDDGTITTWARLTKTPGDDSKFFLLVLKQAPVTATTPPASTATASTKKGSKKEAAAVPALPSPYLQVYVLTVRPGGEADTFTYGIKLAATHKFTPPTAVSATVAQQVRVSSVTLHKIARSICLVWSNGAMQVLQFPVTASVWYSHTPKESFTRQLARFHPDEPAVDTNDMHCAAFALEPSCMVLAGDGPGGSVGLSVWDVRYGVVLALQKVESDATNTSDTTPSTSAAAAAKQKAAGAPEASTVATPSSKPSRKRSDSGSVAGGSLLSSQQAVTLSSLTPESIFQVLVSEDNSYVAIASRKRIVLLDVAARGASLVSAIDRMTQTRAFLAQTENANVMDAASACSSDLKAFMPDCKRVVGAVVPLSTCLAAAGEAANVASGSLAFSGGDASRAVCITAWEATLRASQEECLRDCSAILDTGVTPSAASIAEIITKYAETDQWLTARSDAKGLVGKRARNAKSDAAVPTVDHKIVRVAPTIPAAIIYSVGARCTAELRRFLKGASCQIGVCAVTRPLLHAGCLTANAMLPFLTALLDAVSAPTSKFSAGAQASAASEQVAGKKRSRKSVAAPGMSERAGEALGADDLLVLLKDLLTQLSDIPESFLIRVFTSGLHRIPSRRLRHLWVAQTQGGVKDAPGDTVGLVYLTALLVAAPRNDVFLEQALASLTIDDAAALLACLLRLVESHAERAAAPSAKEGSVHLASICTYGQVLDWIRMTFDAHFTRFILATKVSSAADEQAPASSTVRALLQDFVRLMRHETAICELSSGLRAQVLHLLGGGPLPMPPPPDHLIEFMEL